MTQNVDGLHAAAGSRPPGRAARQHPPREVLRRRPHGRDLGPPSGPVPPVCARCGSAASAGRSLVRRGAAVHAAIEAAGEAALRCDVFLSVGTSGLVEPAASLARSPALAAGAQVIEVESRRHAAHAAGRRSCSPGPREACCRRLVPPRMCPWLPSPRHIRIESDRARHADRRALLRAPARRVRRRGDQDRDAGRGRSAAQVAQAARRQLALVVRAGAQQEIGRASNLRAARRRRRSCARLARERRHRGRELPPRHAGEVEPRLRARCRATTRSWSWCGISGFGQTGPVPRPAGLRRDRRVDGRHALHHRLSRSRAGARRASRSAIRSPRCSA